MKSALLGLIFLLPLFACQKSQQSQAASQSSRLKQMLSETDVLLVKHFYGESDTFEDRDSKYPELNPGMLGIEPIWVYEPQKQAQGLKGAILRVRQSYFFDSDARMQGGEKAEIALDFDELRDLNNSLLALQAKDADWRTAPTGEHIEMQFSSKDGFSLSAFHSPETHDDVLYFKIDGRSVGINAGKVQDLINETNSAIQLLKAKG
jgi:hypothetical protein